MAKFVYTFDFELGNPSESEGGNTSKLEEAAATVKADSIQEGKLILREMMKGVKYHSVRVSYVQQDGSAE